MTSHCSTSRPCSLRTLSWSGVTDLNVVARVNWCAPKLTGCGAPHTTLLTAVDLVGVDELLAWACPVNRANVAIEITFY